MRIVNLSDAAAMEAQLVESLQRRDVPLAAASRSNPATGLKDATSVYKVDTEAIDQKVKQEFAAKDKAKKEAKPEPKLKPVATRKKAA